MKPLAQRIAAYIAITPVDTTTLQAYERILWALEQERIGLEEAVWKPRISARRWRRLHTRRAELLDIIVIVKALRDRHTGNPTSPPLPKAPPRTRPTTGYGE